MIKIEQHHEGRRVRIRGIVPLGGEEYILGEGNHTGVITYVAKGRFMFNDECHGQDGCFLKVSFWRIEEVFYEPSPAT